MRTSQGLRTLPHPLSTDYLPLSQSQCHLSTHHHPLPTTTPALAIIRGISRITPTIYCTCAYARRTLIKCNLVHVHGDIIARQFQTTIIINKKGEGRDKHTHADKRSRKRINYLLTGPTYTDCSKLARFSDSTRLYLGRKTTTKNTKTTLIMMEKNQTPCCCSTRATLSVNFEGIELL